MKIELDLSAVPVPCWWWTGLVVYLLISWLVVGPYFSRWAAACEKRSWGYVGPHPEILWFFAPLYWPVVVPGMMVWYVIRSVFGSEPLMRLIYGKYR